MGALLWRRGWDSNPRDVSAKLISSQPRYDHFDTSACMFCAASRFQRKNLWATLWATQPQYSIFEPSENPEITGFPMA